MLQSPIMYLITGIVMGIIVATTLFSSNTASNAQPEKVVVEAPVKIETVTVYVTSPPVPQLAVNEPKEDTKKEVEKPQGSDGLCGTGLPKPMPTLKNRDELGDMLQREGMKIGVELGVQRGLFAEVTLRRWHTCEQYHLVDLWAPQKNYRDAANVDQNTQNAHLAETRSRTQRWAQKIQICKGMTLECVKKYPDGYFDYIYVDARHDRKGVFEDLEAWWPKLRCGGIMAGHDYVEQREITDGQDWTLNYDGSRDVTKRVVKGAVDDFFMGSMSAGHRRQVSVCYREHMWNTWYVRK